MNKFHFLRALCLVLALLTLGGALIGCRAKLTYNASQSDDPHAIVTRFVKTHQKELNAVVELVLNDTGLSYYYFLGQEEKASRIERLVVGEDGGLTRKSVNNKTLKALAKTGFTGELTYSSESSHGVVSFFTYLHGKGDTTIYFVYCVDDAAVEHLKNGFIVGTPDIKTEKIVGKWYFIEVDNTSIS